MIYLLIIIGLSLLVVFCIYPKHSSIVLILLLLTEGFHFIDFGTKFLIPVLPGISLNIIDICALATGAGLAFF